MNCDVVPTFAVRGKEQFQDTFDMKTSVKVALLGWLALSMVPSALAERSDERVLLGYLETAFLGELTLRMNAKLDTGADTSSVYAHDIDIYEKSGRDDWVRYRLIGEDGRIIRFDKNVIRFALIKTKTGGVIRRPVVLLDVCVGGVAGRAEFNLADREDFDYDVLIGREFLASRVIVDSADSFSAEDACDSHVEKLEKRRAKRRKAAAERKSGAEDD